MLKLMLQVLQRMVRLLGANAVEDLLDAAHVPSLAAFLISSHAADIVAMPCEGHVAPRLDPMKCFRQILHSGLAHAADAARNGLAGMNSQPCYRTHAMLREFNSLFGFSFRPELAGAAHIPHAFALSPDDGKTVRTHASREWVCAVPGPHTLLRALLLHMASVGDTMVTLSDLSNRYKSAYGKTVSEHDLRQAVTALSWQFETSWQGEVGVMRFAVVQDAVPQGPAPSQTHATILFEYLCRAYADANTSTIAPYAEKKKPPMVQGDSHMATLDKGMPSVAKAPAAGKKRAAAFPAAGGGPAKQSRTAGLAVAADARRGAGRYERSAFAGGNSLKQATTPKGRTGIKRERGLSSAPGGGKAPNTRHGRSAAVGIAPTLDPNPIRRFAAAKEPHRSGAGRPRRSASGAPLVFQEHGRAASTAPARAKRQGHMTGNGAVRGGITHASQSRAAPVTHASSGRYMRNGREVMREMEDETSRRGVRGGSSDWMPRQQTDQYGHARAAPCPSDRFAAPASKPQTHEDDDRAPPAKTKWHAQTRKEVYAVEPKPQPEAVVANSTSTSWPSHANSAYIVEARPQAVAHSTFQGSVGEQFAPQYSADNHMREIDAVYNTGQAHAGYVHQPTAQVPVVAHQPSAQVHAVAHQASAHVPDTSHQYSVQVPSVMHQPAAQASGFIQQPAGTYLVHANQAQSHAPSSNAGYLAVPSSVYAGHPVYIADAPVARIATTPDVYIDPQVVQGYEGGQVAGPQESMQLGAYGGVGARQGELVYNTRDLNGVVTSMNAGAAPVQQLYQQQVHSSPSCLHSAGMWASCFARLPAACLVPILLSSVPFLAVFVQLCHVCCRQSHSPGLLILLISFILLLYTI
jgi:hypothetical protein